VTPGSELARLRSELTRLRETVQDLSSALHAAATGELAPAERFVAGGVLGIQGLDRGGYIVDWSDPRVLPYRDGRAPENIQREYRPLDTNLKLFLPRLYVPPSVAHHFELVAFEVDHRRRLLGSGFTDKGTVPCELFARRYGSPRFDWAFESWTILELRVINVSNQPRPFQLLGLGYEGYQEDK